MNPVIMRIDPRHLPTREGTQAEGTIHLISAEIIGFGSCSRRKDVSCEHAILTNDTMAQEIKAQRQTSSALSMLSYYIPKI